MKLFNQKAKGGWSLEELKDFPDIKDKITGQVVHGCSFNIAKNMFLFDDKNLYVVKMKKSGTEIKPYENVFCVGI